MRSALRWGVIASTLAVSIHATALGRAEERAAEREAQLRFEEGIARVKAANFEGARVSFTQAFAVLHKPYILWNLALAEEKTGHSLDALEHFKEFARGQANGDDRVAGQKHIADLTGQTGHFDVAAPNGSQVVVDGSLIGTAPLDDVVDVMPGRHRIEARGLHESSGVDADATAGRVVRVVLQPAADGNPPPAIPVAQPTTPAAIVPPPPVAPLPPGHTDGKVHSQEPSAARAVTVILIGTTAVASFGMGGYFALQSQSDASTVAGFRMQYPNDYCFRVTGTNSAACSQWNDAVQAQGRDATSANVFYVTGGVLAAGAVATWLLWPKPSVHAQALVVPVVSASGLGLSAVGCF